MPGRVTADICRPGDSLSGAGKNTLYIECCLEQNTLHMGGGGGGIVTIFTGAVRPAKWAATRGMSMYAPDKIFIPKYSTIINNKIQEVIT
jgi:hypothetical protein